MQTSESGVTPQTIPDVPIPILDTQPFSANQTAGGVQPSSLESQTGVQQQSIKDVPVAKSPIASDIVGTAFDTQQRRILGQFSFGQVGALKVGKYSPGVSGEIDISPNGILGLDKNGNSRFGLDTNGVLTLKNGSNTAVLDGSGIISTANFPGGQIANVAAGLSTNSNTPVDVPGSSIGSITTTRTLKVLFFLTARGANDSIISSDMGNDLNVLIYDSFLAGGIANVLIFGIPNTRFDGLGGAVQSIGDQQVSVIAILNVAPGTHNFKLQYYAESGGNALLHYWVFGFVVLGS